MRTDTNAQALRAACETLYAQLGKRWLNAQQFDSQYERMFGARGTSARNQALALKVIGQGEKGDYCLVAAADLISATLRITEDGYPSARVVGEQDIPLRREQLLPVGVLLDGAKILVRKPAGRSRYGSLVSIDDAGQKKTVLAEATRKERGYWFFDAVEPKTLSRICVKVERSVAVRLGESYQITLSGHRGKQGDLEGRVVGPGEMGTSLSTKVEQILDRFSLNHPDVAPEKNEQTAWKELVSHEKISNYRRDLRRELFYTIDGKSAKDFDDAIAVERIDSGYRIQVAVADVAAFVTEGSQVDLAARERGTSVYFPDFILPMLPAQLSDDLCSLRPEEDRLALVVAMEFDENGRRLGGKLFEGMIRSKYRLTYTEVKHFLNGETPERFGSHLTRSLQNLAELTALRRTLRAGRGGLDFDLPEPFIEIGMRGEVTAILRRERHLAHFMIEEMMIVANETVAEILTNAGYPALYRNHPSPPDEKREVLSAFLSAKGVVLDGDWGGRELQEAIESFAGLAIQKTVQIMALRSMAQARYDVTNIGHWGLVSPCYCHFTSPIRRYPDLLVHRLVKRYLRRGDLPPGPARQLRASLERLGGKLGDLERNAEAAERAMAQHLKARFAAEHIGQTSAATVTGVVNFGLFAELESPFCEGLVHVSRLGDDNWVFDEKLMRLVGRRTRRTWSLGDTIYVRIARADVERDRIDLELVEPGGV